jgi:hypothetical protein
MFHMHCTKILIPVPERSLIFSAVNNTAVPCLSGLILDLLIRCANNILSETMFSSRVVDQDTACERANILYHEWALTHHGKWSATAGAACTCCRMNARTAKYSWPAA